MAQYVESLQTPTPVTSWLDEEVEVSRATYQAYQILYYAFIALPAIAGLDKFLHVLTTWDNYVSPGIASILHLTPAARDVARRPHRTRRRGHGRAQAEDRLMGGYGLVVAGRHQSADACTTITTSCCAIWRCRPRVRIYKIVGGVQLGLSYEENIFNAHLGCRTRYLRRRSRSPIRRSHTTTTTGSFIAAWSIVVRRGNL